MSQDVHVYIDASGAFPELARRDQIRGPLTGVGGVRRMNGPTAVLLVGRTKHGRPIALEVRLSTLVAAVEALRLGHRAELESDPADVVQGGSQ